MISVFLVKRGPREPYHNAPFHPVIICGKHRIAKHEAGWTGDAAWVWSHERGDGVSGWLLERWNGFDIDYGHIVRGFTLPGCDDDVMVHKHTGRQPWTLLAGAVWWDDRRMPPWLEEAGVAYPPDRFSQQRILDSITDGGMSGFGRERPSFWAEPAPLQRFVITGEPRIPDGTPITYSEGIGRYEQRLTGTVISLEGIIELPNGRYYDEYKIRRGDGTETVRYRFMIEKQNAEAVRA